MHFSLRCSYKQTRAKNAVCLLYGWKEKTTLAGGKRKNWFVPAKQLHDELVNLSTQDLALLSPVLRLPTPGLGSNWLSREVCLANFGENCMFIGLSYRTKVSWFVIHSQYYRGQNPRKLLSQYLCRETAELSFFSSPHPLRDPVWTSKILFAL